jgi:hypothetical protein
MPIKKEDISKAYRLQLKRTKAYDEDNELEPQKIKQQIEEIMSEIGYSRIGSGDYRIVYGNESRVVKIAWHDAGVRENKSEIQNWRHIKHIPVKKLNSPGKCEARNYLAELIDYDANNKGWIVMERVSIGSNNVTTEEAKELRNNFSDAGINIDEVNPYNMGRKYRENIGEKVPVVFDYGGT